MKELILQALHQIEDSPYLTGQKFEWACLHTFVVIFEATPFFPTTTERLQYQATKGATFYKSNHFVIIFQPHGSQASPDIEIWSFTQCLLKIECKANENAAQPNWNQHIPYQNVLYIWTSKRKGVFIRAGWQLISSDEEQRVRDFYQELKRMAKSFNSDESSLDVAMRYNLSPSNRDQVYSEDHDLTQSALDWACKNF